MPSHRLITLLLLTLCFSLAAWLDPRRPVAKERLGQPETVLGTLLGESRRLLASQLFIKADAYYHMGNYPSIFDRHDDDAHEPDASHGAMLAKAGLHDLHDCAGHDEAARDWLDLFGRNFYPSKHLHADQVGQQAQQEILPWLRLSAELDPQNVATYTLAAYWLRVQLNRPADAEVFLREGLRANPGSPDILLELGRLRLEHHPNAGQACNILELALRRWDEQESAKPEPDIFVRQQILAQLVLATRQLKQPQQVIHWLRLLQKHSPNPASIQQQIDEIKKSFPTP